MGARTNLSTLWDVPKRMVCSLGGSRANFGLLEVYEVTSMVDEGVGS